MTRMLFISLPAIRMIASALLQTKHLSGGVFFALQYIVTVTERYF